jgi:hypothetical protein
MRFTLIFLILLAGCNHIQKNNNIEELEYPALPPHVIEINEVPHPFSLNDFNKYIVWVNGTRVNMKPKDKLELITLIGAENIKPIPDEDIHNGDGWLRPIFPNRASFNFALGNPRK